MLKNIKFQDRKLALSFLHQEVRFELRHPDDLQKSVRQLVLDQPAVQDLQKTGHPDEVHLATAIQVRVRPVDFVEPERVALDIVAVMCRQVRGADFGQTPRGLLVRVVHAGLGEGVEAHILLVVVALVVREVEQVCDRKHSFPEEALRAELGELEQEERGGEVHRAEGQVVGFFEVPETGADVGPEAVVEDLGELVVELEDAFFELPVFGQQTAGLVFAVVLREELVGVCFSLLEVRLPRCRGRRPDGSGTGSGLLPTCGRSAAGLLACCRRSSSALTS